MALPMRPQAHNKLPGLAGPLLAAIYLVLAAAPLVLGWAQGTKLGTFAGELGAGLALAATSLLFLQFLSSGRYESLSGRIGLDRTLGFHRLAAIVLLSLAVLHPVAYVAPLLIANPAAALRRLSGMFSAPGLRTGVAALVSLGVLGALAALRGKPVLPYEIWRGTHSLLAALAAGLVLHHATHAGLYSGAPILEALWLSFTLMAAGALLVTFVLRPARARSQGWQVSSVTRDCREHWELTLTTAAKTPFAFRGGQFVWLSIGAGRVWYADHPFSIISSPAELPRLRFLVREAGDFTRTIGSIPPGTPAAVDGPHGSFVLSQAEDRVLLIAGGVGIAPVLGLLEDAAADGDKRAFRLIYATRDRQHAACSSRLDALAAKLDLSIRTLCDEVGTTPEADHGPLAAGHVRSLLGDWPARTTAAFVCGPPRMMEIATDALLEAGLASSAIHYERFDFAAGSGRLDVRRRNQSLAVFAVLGALILAFAAR